MRIQEFRERDAGRLFEYWQRLGASVPFFFPVSIERWQACLLNDELNGERLFRQLETHLAVVDERVAGVVQFGRPHLAWDTDGKKSHNPNIGVIRHLFFDKEMPAVGEALLMKASHGLARFSQQYAFYHALGMSCHVHHGKLHSSQRHVEHLLLAHDFRIEHENVYCVLDMNRSLPKGEAGLRLDCTPASCSDVCFTARLDTDVVGTAQVRQVDRLTDGYTRDTAYLVWLGVEKRVQGQGIGTEILRMLAEVLLRQGYRYLHTDTAKANIRARLLYEKLGFVKKGSTQSFIRE